VCGKSNQANITAKIAPFYELVALGFSKICVRVCVCVCVCVCVVCCPLSVQSNTLLVALSVVPVGEQGLYGCSLRELYIVDIQIVIVFPLWSFLQIFLSAISVPCRVC
jgi:hypothetical protein